MSVETVCPGCSSKLRVEATHAGRQVRCAICNTICTVPGNPADDSVTSTHREQPREQNWYMRTPEGRTFGPSSKSEVDTWVAEGRVTSDCQLRTEDTDDWQPADEHYPKLRPRAAVPSTTGSPLQADVANTSMANQHRPHRAVLILILGILGCTACPIFAISAWVMGSSDLTEMREGRMDSSGMGLTQAGQILGMVCSTILIVVAVVVAFFLIFVAGSM